jgi:2,5-diamino-6-(ribosylamino)-4(3H)-pyrimidinone 5'-phosphate reductase
MLPRVILHNAVSLDGRIDWLTPDVGLFYELASRWKEDATLASSNTIYNLSHTALHIGRIQLLRALVEGTQERAC